MTGQWFLRYRSLYWGMNEKTNKQTNKQSHAWNCFKFSDLQWSSQQVLQFMGTMMLLLGTSPVAPLCCMSTSQKYTKVIPVNGEVHLTTMWQLKGTRPFRALGAALTLCNSVHYSEPKYTFNFWKGQQTWPFTKITTSALQHILFPALWVPYTLSPGCAGPLTVHQSQG